jgi:hypothetical protein
MGKAVAHAERKSADLKFLVDLVHDGGRLNDFRECAIRFYLYDFAGGARVVPARSISALSRRNLDEGGTGQPLRIGDNPRSAPSQDTANHRNGLTCRANNSTSVL